MKELNYKNIKIRSAQAEDCEQLAEWWNDGTVMAHAGFPNGIGINAEEIEQKISHDTDNTRRRLIIEIDLLRVGEMSYSCLDNNTAEIGIKICNTDYQNRGFGKIILSMLIAHLFEAGNEKIVLDTNLKNLRAQYVYEELGFQKVRVNENSWRDQLGELQTSIDYEMKKENFIDFRV